MFLTVPYKKGFIHSNSKNEKGSVKATLSFTKYGITHCMHATCKTQTSAKRWISLKIKEGEF